MFKCVRPDSHGWEAYFQSVQPESKKTPQEMDHVAFDSMRSSCVRSHSFPRAQFEWFVDLQCQKK